MKTVSSARPSVKGKTHQTHKALKLIGKCLIALSVAVVLALTIDTILCVRLAQMGTDNLWLLW